jgi:flagellar biogenesis protein FliO
MQHLQSLGEMKNAKKSFEVQGLAGWVFGMLRGWRGESVAHDKQMRLVETLALGGKRQLMLVACGGEHFLVGGGVESVETIVRVKADALQGEMAQRRDEICL